MRAWVPLTPQQIDVARRLWDRANAEPFIFALSAAIYFVTGRLRSMPVWLHDEIIYEVWPVD